MATFSDLIENIIKDFSVYGLNFEEYLEKLVQLSRMPRNALSP